MRPTLLILALAALWAGCSGGGCSPMEDKKTSSSGGGAAPTATPGPVTILNEAYASGVGNWADHSVNAQMVNNPADGKIANGCISMSSPGYNTDFSDHFRNDLTTTATAVTTRFAYDFQLLAGLTNTAEVRLELDNVSRWRFEIDDNGSTIKFNGATISCGACGTATVWHTVVVVSNGNTTTSLVVDGTPVGSFTALSNNLAADDFIDKVHIVVDCCLNGPGTVFQMDDVSVTAP